MDKAKEIAEAIRDSEYWSMEACQELCDAAGMGAEFAAADGDTFESVVFKAAEKLGVEV